jgi:TonB family protein
MKIPANPTISFPSDAKREGISGSALVEATVAPDGHARSARVAYSLPAGVFDEAARPWR